MSQTHHLTSNQVNRGPIWLVNLSWIAIVGGAGLSLPLAGSYRLAAVTAWALGVLVQLTAATYAFWASQSPRHGTFGREPANAR